ncbi:hypothetical protein A0H81_08912 [Grifola frondosa]|uniref:Uncharacterized protein n=1 Tax=Grifola frondosa TaxID=5627 RepID=A0A1C7M405_GRIFR|nr:hypothetical protein A0H81_08912 [Grifola frondosa]
MHSGYIRHIPAKDASGNVVMCSGEFIDGAIIFPLPFKRNIRPRSPHVGDIIAEAAYIHVSALEAGIIHLPLNLFAAGTAVNETSVCPSLAFSLLHSRSNTHLVFDLGVRRDMESHPPAVKAVIEKWTSISVPQSVDESLKNGGFDPADAPIARYNFTLPPLLSVWGDATAFPTPHLLSAKAAQSCSVMPADRTRFPTAANFNMSIGPFLRAYDGDDSLYRVDAIGHLAGYINVLARTSADGSWLYLAGDMAHDVHILTGEREMAFMMDPSGYTKTSRT